MHKIDAVGSGATMNETAKQIKDRKIAKKVIGIAITGSFKGFDVISEVYFFYLFSKQALIYFHL